MRLYFKNWGSKIVPQKFYIIKKIFTNDAYMLEIKNVYYTFNLIINSQYYLMLKKSKKKKKNQNFNKICNKY